MATRSAIAIQLPKNRFLAIYCHYDGYPEHQLPILTDDYATFDSVINLVMMGDLSSLSSEHDWERKKQKKINKNKKNFPPLTYSSRGEQYDAIRPKVFKSLAAIKKYFTDCWCEHLYVYDTEWVHHSLIETTTEQINDN